MTWLFLMNSSEGCQVTIRDFRMFPSLLREAKEFVAYSEAGFFLLWQNI